MERREFIQQLERTALGACAFSVRASLPVLVGACASMSYVRGDLRDGALVVPIASLALDGTALVEMPGSDLPLFVRRVSPGNALALLTRCMHRGCQVEPEIDRLVCPCHGSEYALDGSVLRGPTTRPLARFRVSENGQTLRIDLVPVGP